MILTDGLREIPQLYKEHPIVSGFMCTLRCTNSSDERYPLFKIILRSTLIV